MCTYSITLNDELLTRTRKTFADERAMNVWLQQQVEALLTEYNAQQQLTRDNARRAIEEMRRQSEQNGNTEMTLEDINEEIRMAREARKVAV